MESTLKEVLDVLPIDLASRIEFLIVLLQAVGGLFVIYFIYTLVKFFMIRKEEKIIEFWKTHKIFKRSVSEKLPKNKKTIKNIFYTKNHSDNGRGFIVD